MKQNNYDWHISGVSWHTMEELHTTDDKRKIIGMALSMWGCCVLEHPPTYFGDWMVIANEKLGFIPLPENLHKEANKILNNEL